MEQQGFIKLYRKMLSWEWYTDPNTLSTFIYLLLSANYAPKKWKGGTLQKGQLVTKYSDIKDVTGLSVHTIRTCLKRLEKTKEITVESTNKYTIITVCNYDSYQCGSVNQGNQRDNNGTTTEQQPNNNGITTEQESDNNGTTTEQQPNNVYIKNIKNTKNTKNNEKEKNLLTEEYENTARAYTHTHTSTHDTPASVITEPAETFPYREIADGWNSVCRSLPKIVSLSQKRKNEIKSRCNEWKKQLQRDDYTKVADELFHKIEQSDFLTGRSGKSWKADFDWVFKNDTNWLKVWEGNYSNHGSTVGMNVPLRDGWEFEGSEDDFLNFNLKP